MRENAIFLILTTLLATLACACQDGARPQRGAADPAASIMGGQIPLRADDPGAASTGLLKIQRSVTYKLLDEPVIHTDSETCSAVLIAPDLMLTAAHCVMSTEMLSIVSFDQGVLQLQGSVDFPTQHTSVDIAKALYHRDFKTSEAFESNGQLKDQISNDLALILLRQNAPASLKPVPIARPFESEILLLRIRMYGFGLTDGIDPLFDDLTPLLRYTDVMGTFHRSDKTITYDQSGGSGFCYGDSGGPHFAETSAGTVLQLVGLTSRLGNAKPGTQDPCRTNSVAVAVGEYQDWIQRATLKIRDPHQGSGSF